jgi:hypothetical protein
MGTLTYKTRTQRGGPRPCGIIAERLPNERLSGSNGRKSDTTTGRSGTSGRIKADSS